MDFILNSILLVIDCIYFWGKNGMVIELEVIIKIMEVSFWCFIKIFCLMIICCILKGLKYK